MQNTVKQVTSKNETYQGPNGLLYKFQYTFEDGLELTANHQTQEAPFKPGDQVEVTVRGESQYGKYGAVKKLDSYQASSGGGKSYGGAKGKDQQDQIMRQSSLKAAVEALGLGMEPVQYTGLAEYFYNYVSKGIVEAKKGGEDVPF